MKHHPHERYICRLAAWLAVALGVVALPVTVRAIMPPPPEGGMAVPSIPMTGVQPAASCVVSLPWFGHQDYDYLAPHGSMNMTNEGGSCVLQFVEVFREIYVLPEISVVEPPNHGEARAEQLPKRFAVVYRPAPGFVGTDHFAVHTNGPIPHTIPIDVTVR
jgi:hypothetical protein